MCGLPYQVFLFNYIVLLVTCIQSPFRQLKWIIKGAERLETLVSISTDGRVLEWNLKKGLVVSMLMQLKKSGTVSILIALYCASLSRGTCLLQYEMLFSLLYFLFA